jgi:hypothetical protein
MDENQNNPKQPGASEYVLSIVAVGNEWHAAIIENGRMTQVYKDTSLEKVVDFAGAFYTKKNYEAGTRIVIRTSIEPNA